MSDGTGRGDFDFFAGSWNSIQRRLTKPLPGCDEWAESSAARRCWQVFCGAANIDEVHFPDRGFTGLTIRLLYPAEAEWSIYWVSSRNGQLLLPPVTGRFSNGTGMFYDQEQYEGRDVTVRSGWSDITAATARRDQAFSEDGGQTWETSWTADFTRTD